VSANPHAGEGLRRLRELLRSGGGMMASLAQAPAPAPDAGASPALLAAEGPRAARAPEEYELLIEAIFEGYLLHYGTPRVVRVREADLGLLAGDQLYAIGLARLVELGDIFAVSELADTISLSALAHGCGALDLAEQVWLAGARAVGWGPSDEHARAKSLLLAGDPGAFEAMRTSAAGAPAPP
jgi:hypothetical protein